MPTRRGLLKVVGGAVLAVALLLVLVNWTWGRLPGEPERTGRVAQVGDTTIRYVERPGKGTPVLLIHGLPGTAADFERVTPLLRGRRSIAIDRPGFGFSSGGFHAFDEQVAAVDGLLDELGIAKAVVVGHSYGGAVAIGFAQRHPERVRGLVLVAPAAGGTRMDAIARAEARVTQAAGLPVVKQLARATMTQAVLTATADLAVGEAFDPDPVDAGHKERVLALNMQDEDLDALAGERLEANDVIAGIDRRLPETRTPAVVIHGDGDRLIDPEHARTLARALPDARLVMVEGGHMVQYVHPGVVASAVLRFG